MTERLESLLAELVALQQKELTRVPFQYAADLRLIDAGDARGGALGQALPMRERSQIRRDGCCFSPGAPRTLRIMIRASGDRRGRRLHTTPEWRPHDHY